jgi:hypothetical protein
VEELADALVEELIANRPFKVRGKKSSWQIGSSLLSSTKSRLPFSMSSVMSRAGVLSAASRSPPFASATPSPETTLGDRSSSPSAAMTDSAVAGSPLTRRNPEDQGAPSALALALSWGAAARSEKSGALREHAAAVASAWAAAAAWGYTDSVSVARAEGFARAFAEGTGGAQMAHRCAGTLAACFSAAAARLHPAPTEASHVPGTRPLLEVNRVGASDGR